MPHLEWSLEASKITNFLLHLLLSMPLLALIMQGDANDNDGAGDDGDGDDIDDDASVGPHNAR